MDVWWSIHTDEYIRDLSVAKYVVNFFETGASQWGYIG